MTFKRRMSVVVALAFIAAACASEALTVAQYVEAMEEATETYIAESQTLSETFQREVTNQISDIVEMSDATIEDRATDITKREMVQYLSLLEDAMSRYLENISSLAPPDSVVDPHSDYVAALDAVVGALPEAGTAISQAGDLSGIQGALAGSDFRDGQYRLASTCASLEAAVRSQDRGLDLGCVRL